VNDAGRREGRPAPAAASAPPANRQGVLRDHLTLAVFTVVWGANFVLAELALRQLSPIGFSVSRFAVATATLFALGQVALVRGDDARVGSVLRRRPWGLLAVALVGVVLAPWLGIEGLARTHAGRAALYVSISPAVSLLLAPRELAERTRPLVGTGLLVAGTAALVVDPAEVGVSVGDLLLLVASLAVVLDLHLMRPLAIAYGPAHVSAWRTLVGGALYLLVALPWLVDEPWANLTPLTWVAVVLGGAVGVGLGQWVKARAVRTLGATKVLAYFNLVPVTTLILRALATGRLPSGVEVLACGVIVAGATLINAARVRS